MFIGHFGVGFAARRLAPQVPLVVLFLAAQLADVLWPMFLAAGLEEVRVLEHDNPLLRLEFVSYPYSHSLVMLLLWGAGLGLLYRAATGNGRALGVLAAVVASHWVLDWITHRPDMPLYPHGPTAGLGLWNSVPWTLVAEIVLFAGGLWVYAKAAHLRQFRALRIWALAAFLLVGYIASLVGPPPPSVRALYASTIVLFSVVLLWSWWAEKA